MIYHCNQTLQYTRTEVLQTHTHRGQYQMDQCLNLERAFFNPCEFFSDNRVTEELCSKGKLSNTGIHSKRGIRYLFLGKKMKNHGIIFAFQRQGILCQCILEKHRKKDRTLTSIHVTNMDKDPTSFWKLFQIKTESEFEGQQLYWNSSTEAY